MLDVVQPSLVAPVPSMAIAEFAADPRQARSLGGLVVPAGTSLFAHAGDGITVRWRTGMPVALGPSGSQRQTYCHQWLSSAQQS